jgi:DNA-directed RNA polymerase subunit RPC12/RpoP
VITLRCANCGAPLEVDDHASLAQCKYCHATTRVRDRTLQMPATGATPRAPVIYAPPGPAAWPTPPQIDGGGPHVATPRAQKSSGCSLLVASTVLFSAIGVGIGVYGLQNGGASVLGGNGNSLFAAMAEPAPVLETCFVDANGDAAADVVVLHLRDSKRFAEIVDGATGASRWRGEEIAGDVELLCVGHHVVLALGDFTTRIHDARAPQTPLVVRGSDVTRKVRAGVGCLDLEGADDSRLDVAVDGSGATSCEPAGVEHGVHDDAPGVMSLTDDAVELQDGDAVLRLQVRQRGTPILNLRTVARGPDTQLAVIKCAFSAAIAVNATTIFLQACAPGDDDAGFVIALRRSDLTELWRKPLDGLSTNNVSFFSWNGSALIVQSFGAVYAYDGGNGTSLWSNR